MLSNGTNQNDRHLPPKHLYNEVVESCATPRPSKADPDGSYTGLPKNPHEMPQQDADDL